MPMVLLGATDPVLTRDEDGYREYTVTYLVEGLTTDGPLAAITTPGLPYPGSFWQFAAEFDTLAWCRLDTKVSSVLKKEIGNQWTVEMKFSSKGTPKRCKDQEIDNPLLEPMKVSGNSVKFTEEGVLDRFGRRILNSAFEQIRGPQNEWDNNRHIVKIEQNVAALDNALCCSLVDCVNDRPMWGLAARKIKLSNYTWERKFYGSCYVYYTRTFEFEINYRTWDRDLLDEGTKALSGHWNSSTGAWDLDNINGAVPNPLNPAHFIRFQDRRGNTARVILDGAGKPYIPDLTAAVKWWILKEEEGWEGGLGDEDTGSVGRFLQFEATCQEAAFRAFSHGCPIAGPFDSQAAAAAAGTTATFVSAQELRTTCSSNTAPGTRHVEKYLGVNLLLLGVPTNDDFLPSEG